MSSQRGHPDSTTEGSRAQPVAPVAALGPEIALTLTDMVTALTLTINLNAAVRLTSMVNSAVRLTLSEVTSSRARRSPDGFELSAFDKCAAYHLGRGK